ncbi:lipoyl(octanoyl) transferase LipB [Humitalea sp. 24SJ18S-53]|uniref:lipoyl(octanoyl) transferase LipB n=1 Tax=Humitalea sp. 24SJ18S-53 TaxID=3422307 RepID=UPI003D66536D
MTGNGSTGPAWLTAPGLLPYPQGLAAMAARAAAIRAGTAGDLVWLVEHPPTYTSGTSATPEGMLDARFPVFAAGRGGQWTYHGPGQRTAYVMLDLTRDGRAIPPRDVRAYVQALEGWVIAALARFGVVAERREGRIGLWVARPGGREDKVAAIGVRITRWVAWHGIAVNVAPDLSHFGGIVPCGIRQHGVTSLRDLGIPATMADLDAALRAAWPGAFG